MRTLFLILCGWMPVTAFLQNPFTVMDWNTGSSFNNYLLEKAHRQYQQRSIAFNKAVASKQAAIAYINDTREKYRRLIGDVPAVSPLNAKIAGTYTGDGYKIENVLYESFPGHHVTANVYVPDRKGVFPAVLFFCGH